MIDGTTALADAVAFGQWQAARRLLEHGAQTNLWQATALGLTCRVALAVMTRTPQRVREILGAIAHLE